MSWPPKTTNLFNGALNISHSLVSIIAPRNLSYTQENIEPKIVKFYFQNMLKKSFMTQVVAYLNCFTSSSYNISNNNCLQIDASVNSRHFSAEPVHLKHTYYIYILYILLDKGTHTKNKSRTQCSQSNIEMFQNTD